MAPDEAPAAGARRAAEPLAEPRVDAAVEVLVTPEVRDGPEGSRPALPRLTVMLVTLAAVALALGLVRELREFIGPVFFALNMMIAGYPIHRWLVRRRVPAWLASMAAGLVVMAVLGALVWGLIWSIAQMIGVLPTYQEQFTNLYHQSIELLTRVGFSEQVILDQISKVNLGFDTVSSVLGPLLSGTGGLASLLGVIGLASVFIVMDMGGMHHRVAIASRSHPRFGTAMHDFTAGVRRYWLVTTVFGLIVGMLDGAVLIGLGVPLPLVWTLFSFLTNYIPNVGFVVGLIPPALLALVDGGVTNAIIVVAAYIVLNSVIQGIIQPRYAGDAVGITPTMSFLSLLLWGWALGGLGTILALPCTLLIKAILVDADPGVRWVNALISNHPADDRAGP